MAKILKFSEEARRGLRGSRADGDQTRDDQRERTGEASERRDEAGSDRMPQVAHPDRRTG